MSAIPIKMINKTFGYLKVLKESNCSIPRFKKFVVKCTNCNKIFIMAGCNIRRHNKTKANGCKYCYFPNRKHGLWNHRFYSTWDGMIRRCYNKKHIAYKDYGGRGITVCKEWRKSPIEFIKWCIDNGLKKPFEIDRKNNNGNYCPKNCRIVTTRTNQNNKRNNRFVIIYNEKLTISEAARKYNIKYTTLKERLNMGYTGDQAISRFNLNFKNNSVTL